MTFVDSGAWIALSELKDQKHGQAAAIFNQLRQQNERLLTTDYVIDETVTRLRYDRSHTTATKFLDDESTTFYGTLKWNNSPSLCQPKLQLN